MPKFKILGLKKQGAAGRRGQAGSGPAVQVMELTAKDETEAKKIFEREYPHRNATVVERLDQPEKKADSSPAKKEKTEEDKEVEEKE